MKHFVISFAAFFLISGQLVPSPAFAQNPEHAVQLRLLETTDVHVFLANYDYYQTKKDDKVGNVVNAGSSRIVNLTYQEKPVTADQKFIVATNNYRASSFTFPGVSKGEIVLKSPDENRQIIINYLQAQKPLNPSADQNWSLKKFSGTAIPVFGSSQNAQKYLGQFPNIKYNGPSSGGFAKYSFILNQ